MAAIDRRLLLAVGILLDFSLMQATIPAAYEDVESAF